MKQEGGMTKQFLSCRHFWIKSVMPIIDFTIFSQSEVEKITPVPQYRHGWEGVRDWTGAPLPLMARHVIDGK